MTNTGNIALNSVAVADDNGTPGNAADDFNPTFSIGDTNGNNQLNLGEMWLYLATRTVVAGQYTGTGTATGQDSINQLVTDTDAANYFGMVPENADFNDDGIVDGADYLLWRKNNGLTGGATRFQGDANNDGMVNDNDYTIWRPVRHVTGRGGGVIGSQRRRGRVDAFRDWRRFVC